MAKIVFGFRSLNLVELINMVKQLIQVITNQKPDLMAESQQIMNDLNQLMTQIDTESNLLNQLNLQYAAQQTKVDELRTTLENKTTFLGGIIENKANGDEDYIKSLGLKVKSKGTKNTDVPDVPQGIAAFISNNEGEIDLQWDPANGAVSYVVQICSDPLDNTKWQHCKVVIPCKTPVVGLVSGQKYWFRIQAINTNGESDWSEPVGKKVY